jgi:predicted Zn-dependent protease
MKRITAFAVVTLLAATAHAQLGDIFKKIDPEKARKVIDVGRAATREFTAQEEVDLGRVVAARVLATYPLADDDKLQRYVTLVGNTLAAYSARPELEWHFAVIETPIVNAFSTPGGYVFVTTGAMKQLHSEAELATVLAHEIGHVTEKHILKEIKRANVMSASVDFAKSTSTGSWLSDDMAKKIGDLAWQKLFTTGLSRRDEEEADKIAVHVAADAGYRAGEFVTFLDALEKLEGTTEMKVLTATHPRPKDRIAYVKPLVKDDQGEVLTARWEEWTGRR